MSVGRALRQAAALRAQLGRKNGVSEDVLYGDAECPPPMLRGEGRESEEHTLAKRFQPAFVLGAKERLWPLPVSTVFSMEGRKKTICRTAG